MEAIISVAITIALFIYFITTSKTTMEDMQKIAYEDAYHLLIKHKKDISEVAYKLKSYGLDEFQISDILTELQEIKLKKDEMKRLHKENASKNILYGGIWCISGIAFICLSLLFSDSIGFGVLFWGAIIYGFQQLIKGLFYKLKE